MEKQLSFKVKKHKAIYLILSGSIKLEIFVQNGQQNIVKKLKQYNEGDYFSFYDLEYSVDGSQVEIQTSQKKCKLDQINRKNKLNLIEVGCVLLKDNSSLLMKNLLRDQKVQTQNALIIQNYLEITIKKEISLLKLNYSYIQNLTDHQIGQILFNSNLLFFNHKDPVYLNNDDPENVYIVRKGSFCVLWRDQNAIQQRQPIILSNLQQESKQFRRWPLRVFEAKEIFGEEDIINNCRKRNFDVICESLQGQLITLSKNYFLYCLYPLLKTYFSNLIQNKEELFNERINQIRNQLSKPYACVSPSLQSTQPISRECKEISLEDSYYQLQKQDKLSSLSPLSPSPISFSKNDSQVELEKLKNQEEQPIQILGEKKKEDSIDSKKQLIQFLQSSKITSEKKRKQSTNVNNLSIQSKLSTKRKDLIEKQDVLDKKIDLKKKTDTQRNQLQKKCQMKNINFKNYLNSLSYTQKEEREYSQDSLHKFLEQHISLTISSHSTKTNNFVNPIIQTDRLFGKQKNLLNIRQQSEALPSQHQVSPLLKSSTSLKNIVAQQLLSKGGILISNTESPQKNYHHQQNCSQNNFLQSSERRINKKTNRCNTLIKRQANRVSPIQADKTIVLKTSSESASQGTNNSCGGINFLQALQCSIQSNNNISGNNNNKNGVQKFILNSNSSSSISIHSSRTSNNANHQNCSIGNTQDEIQQNVQNSSKSNMLDSLQKNSDLINNSEKRNTITKLESQNKNQLQQKSQQPYSNMVYSKIKEKEDTRKNLKKEYSILNKKGNINALSNYAFKLGNYKIKSEILSNSYENLRQLSNSKQEQINKFRRKFSGDDNITNNKPKYLFTPQFNIQNKFLKKNQGEFLLEKIVGREKQMNQIDVKNPFLSSPLQEDVKKLLSEQQIPLIAIDKLILDQSIKPTITQRALNQNHQAINPQIKIDTFQTDSSPNILTSTPIIKPLESFQQTLTVVSPETQIQNSDQKFIKNSNNCLSSMLSQQNQQQKQYSHSISQKINKIYLNKSSSAYNQLQQIAKYQYMKQNLNQSARNHQIKLKQLLSLSLASPANKNSQILFSNQQQTFSQIFNNSTNQFINNNNVSSKQ